MEHLELQQKKEADPEGCRRKNMIEIRHWLRKGTLGER